MRKTFVLFLVLYSIICYSQEYVKLWPPGVMPNSKGMNIQDSISNERIYRVGEPGMWMFFPSKQEYRGGAVVICPGGGYHHEAFQISGIQLAKWFNTFGMSAFVLKYRLPTSPDLKNRSIAPLQDAQRALRIIRANASEWNIDPRKIGIMGTSAGGHLASTVGTLLEDVSTIEDSIDLFSYSPDFMILISPVIDLGKYAEKGSRDNLLGMNASKELINKFSSQLHVTSATPTTFIVHADDDRVVSVYNSLVFYQELIDSGVCASLHVFPHGGHNIALRNNPGSTEMWTTLCEKWLTEMGFCRSKH
jgi:acetyl esterase/lipase